MSTVLLQPDVLASLPKAGLRGDGPGVLLNHSRAIRPVTGAYFRCQPVPDGASGWRALAA